GQQHRPGGPDRADPGRMGDAFRRRRVRKTPEKKRLSKKSRPDDMRVRSGHLQGNLALRVCEPPCGECAVQRQILSPGTAKLRRVQWTKQPKRSRGSGLPFASPLRRAQQKQGTATTRGKEFLSRVCGQKWVPPGACRFSTRCETSGEVSTGSAVQACGRAGAVRPA